MECIALGNRNAFGYLYDRYFDKLVWFANTYLDDVHKAQDAVQEVFIKIIEKPERFDTSRRFSTWIYTVTANTCKNILRNEQNRARLLQENVTRTDEILPNHRLDHHLLQKDLQKIYSGLSEKEKQIYMLRFEHELAVKEIATIIGIPEGSVKSGIHYLLKKMSVHLKKFTHES